MATRAHQRHVRWWLRPTAKTGTRPMWSRSSLTSRPPSILPLTVDGKHSDVTGAGVLGGQLNNVERKAGSASDGSDAARLYLQAFGRVGLSQHLV